jgi:hypothetical protein
MYCLSATHMRLDFNERTWRPCVHASRAGQGNPTHGGNKRTHTHVFPSHMVVVVYGRKNMGGTSKGDMDQSCQHAIRVRRSHVHMKCTEVQRLLLSS